MSELTLERLEEVLKAEKEGPMPVKLEEDFYYYASELARRLLESQDFFLNKKGEIAKRNLEEIIAIRAEKILLGKRDNALVAEHKLIKLGGEIGKRKAEIFAEMLSPSSEVEIRVKKPIPAFAGPDEKTYGPFQVGQTVRLSQRIVSLLTKHDYVERLIE